MFLSQSHHLNTYIEFHATQWLQKEIPIAILPCEQVLNVKKVSTIAAKRRENDFK